MESYYLRDYELFRLVTFTFQCHITNHGFEFAALTSAMLWFCFESAGSKHFADSFFLQ